MSVSNFVLAFGGTGARCVEALTYLAASRVIREPLQILLIDPDANNGNVSDTRSQLQRYQLVQRTVSRSGESAAFFSTPINEDASPASFLWQQGAPERHLGEKMAHAQQDASTRGLVELLFDHSDLWEIDLKKGYWGRSHMGSFDLLRTLTDHVEEGRDASEKSQDALHAFFARLKSAVMAGETRLFVMGSIFGGTGASGIPAVPPLLRKYFEDRQGLLHNIRLGCIQMTPYFTFGEGSNRDQDPDSTLHPLATQAALYHYGLSDAGYEAIYVAGSPKRTPLSDGNQPGGAEQRNAPHYAELVAAMAAAHFFRNPPPRQARQLYAAGGTEVGWSTLPFGKETQAQANLTSFTAFCLLHAGILHEHLAERRHAGMRWMHTLAAKEARRLSGQEEELAEIKAFAGRYLKWITLVGLARAEDLKVNFFGFDAADKELTSALAAARLERMGRKGPSDAYDVALRKLSAADGIDQDHGVGWYVAALTEATDHLTRTNYAVSF